MRLDVLIRELNENPGIMASLPANQQILGIKITPVTTDELHAYILSTVHNNQKSLILNVNANCINLTYQFPWLRDFLNTAPLVFCDGFGVILASKLLGFHIPERITYADWMWQLGSFAEANNISIFFLGAAPGIAASAAEQLKAKFLNLNIAGVHHGYFDKNHNSAENNEIIKKINQAKPNLLIVGFGMPIQERWLNENWDQIDANIALTGGAVFDYLSGQLKRAPEWMTANGFEWLGRMFIEPRRLWKRYMIGNPIFLWRVLMQKFGIQKFD